MKGTGPKIETAGELFVERVTKNLINICKSGAIADVAPSFCHKGAEGNCGSIGTGKKKLEMGGSSGLFAPGGCVLSADSGGDASLTSGALVVAATGCAASPATPAGTADSGADALGAKGGNDTATVGAAGGRAKRSGGGPTAGR